MIALEQAEAVLAAGEVLVNIGQIDKPTRRMLDKAVRDGVILKWRGYWYPVAGADYGIGPLKTCWGLPDVAPQRALTRRSGPAR